MMIEHITSPKQTTVKFGDSRPTQEEKFMKKTKLKFAAAVAALAMTFALFTGCNPGEDATSVDDGTSTVVDEGEKKTGDGDQATDEKGVTTDETSGTAEGKSPKAVRFLTINLEKNAGGPNNQGLASWIGEDNKYVPKKNDVIKFDFTATANSAPASSDGELKGFIVDNSEAVNYWKVISDYSVSGKKITTDATEYSLEFTLTENASSADSAACKLGLYFGDMQDDTVSLTLSKLKITYNEQTVVNYEASTTVLEDKVVFDPASFTAPAGAEIITQDGEKYLKITPNGYGTSFDISSSALLGYTYLKTTIYVPEALSGVQFVVNVGDSSTLTASGYGKVVTLVNQDTSVGTHSVVKEISDDSFSVDQIQPFVQETSGSWPATTDKDIYIGKIIASTSN